MFKNLSKVDNHSIKHGVNSFIVLVVVSVGIIILDNFKGSTLLITRCIQNILSKTRVWEHSSPDFNNEESQQHHDKPDGLEDENASCQSLKGNEAELNNPTKENHDLHTRETLSDELHQCDRVSTHED